MISDWMRKSSSAENGLRGWKHNFVAGIADYIILMIASCLHSP